MTNPYAAPEHFEAVEQPLRPLRVRFFRGLFFSVVFSLVGGLSGLIGGYLVGGLAFDLFPSYYTDVLFGGNLSRPMVRSTVTMNTSLNGGAGGFWLGLAMPSIGWAWRRWRRRRQQLT